MRILLTFIVAIIWLPAFRISEQPGGKTTRYQLGTFQAALPIFIFYWYTVIWEISESPAAMLLTKNYSFVLNTFVQWYMPSDWHLFVIVDPCLLINCAQYDISRIWFISHRIVICINCIWLLQCYWSIKSKKSSKKTLNKIGPRTEPCGNPMSVVAHSQRASPVFTLCFPLVLSKEIAGFRCSVFRITGKAFARVLLGRLQVLAERILPKSQCGFRSKRSTIDLIF